MLYNVPDAKKLANDAAKRTPLEECRIFVEKFFQDIRTQAGKRGEPRHLSGTLPIQVLQLSAEELEQFCNSVKRAGRTGNITIHFNIQPKRCVTSTYSTGILAEW